MGIDPLNTTGRTSWIIAIGALVAVALVQVYQIVEATGAARTLGIDAPERASLQRLAWLGVAVLSVVLLVLFWLTVRLLKARELGRELPHPPAPYVDAWAAAGERFKLEDDEDDLPEEDDPDDASDG